MDFVFRNAMGDEMTISHSIDDLKKFIAEFGVHIVYVIGDGSDADNLPIYDAETLIKKFPEIPVLKAIQFFQGKGEIYDIERTEIRDNPYKVSICYPIPEIGYDPEPDITPEQAREINRYETSGKSFIRRMLNS